MVKGLAALNRRLSAIPKAVRQAAQASVIKQANAIADLARNAAPEDDGDLKESIVVTAGGESTPPYSQPGGRTVIPELGAAITAGNGKVRYAHLVEFGSKGHPQGGKFKGTDHPGTSAQPFFWPAVRMMRKRTASAVKRAISKAVKDTKK
ncbi:MAG: HK97-gp10 family putative phage morphogenesis protein [Xanthobacter sp.]